MDRSQLARRCEMRRSEDSAQHDTLQIAKVYLYSWLRCRRVKLVELESHFAAIDGTFVSWTLATGNTTPTYRSLVSACQKVKRTGRISLS